MRSAFIREEDRKPEMTVVRNEFERGEVRFCNQDLEEPGEGEGERERERERETYVSAFGRNEKRSDLPTEKGEGGTREITEEEDSGEGEYDRL